MQVDDGEARRIARLRVRLTEQISNLEVSAARYDAGWPEEANRLAVAVRVLAHDTATSRSLLRQMGAKDQMRWIDSNGGVDARNAIMFSSLVVFEMRGINSGSEFRVLSVDQSEILARGRLLDFETWWRTGVRNESVTTDR